MNCEQFEEHVADYLSGSLSAPAAAEFEAHLALCDACRAEARNLGEMWANLGLIRQEQPGQGVRARFYQSLDAYRHGMDAAAPPPPRQAGWWPRPALQFALAAALLLVGVAVGRLLAGAGPGHMEVAQLQGELREMRQMVALALLQQQSPSERLRGVDFSGQVETPDAPVLSALLYTLNHDSNVNVRLAAVDALRRFASTGIVRNALDDSLLKQDSPMVQIALIDLMVSLRNREGAQAIRTLAAHAGVNPEVKQRAAWGLEQLDQ